jgi:hypothetical protein
LVNGWLGKYENCQSVRIGEDPWIGSNVEHRLSDDLVAILRGKGIVSMADVVFVEIGIFGIEGGRRHTI